MRNKLVIHSLFFVLGFTVVFSLIGILIETVFSSTSYLVKQYLSYAGGVIITLFGLYLLGVLKIPFLEKERRFTAKKTRFAYLSSFLFGAAFAAGWSPCVGAILGAILTMAAVSPTSALGLLIAYSLGIGVPFVLAALLADKSHKFMKSFYKHMGVVQKIFGVLLVILGILIFTHQLTVISELAFASELFFSIDTALANQGVGLLVAFIAGLASFLSPCVFPLLPAYFAYLGGLTVSSK
jgi:cytochrome c-type biogenesis protein